MKTDLQARCVRIKRKTVCDLIILKMIERSGHGGKLIVTGSLLVTEQRAKVRRIPAKRAVMFAKEANPAL